MVYKFLWTDGKIELAPAFSGIHHLNLIQRMVDKGIIPSGKMPENYVGGDYSIDDLHPGQFDNVRVLWESGTHPDLNELKYLLQRELNQYGREQDIRESTLERITDSSWHEIPNSKTGWNLFKKKPKPELDSHGHDSQVIPGKIEKPLRWLYHPDVGLKVWNADEDDHYGVSVPLGLEDQMGYAGGMVDHSEGRAMNGVPYPDNHLIVDEYHAMKDKNLQQEGMNQIINYLNTQKTSSNGWEERLYEVLKGTFLGSSAWFAYQTGGATSLRNYITQEVLEGWEDVNSLKITEINNQIDWDLIGKWLHEDYGGDKDIPDIVELIQEAYKDNEAAPGSIKVVDGGIMPDNHPDREWGLTHYAILSYIFQWKPRYTEDEYEQERQGWIKGRPELGNYGKPVSEDKANLIIQQMKEDDEKMKQRMDGTSSRADYFYNGSQWILGAN